MTEPLVCEGCGHTDDLHDEMLGYCNAKGCRCIAFRVDDFEDDDDDEDDNFRGLDRDELDFDHGQ